MKRAFTILEILIAIGVVVLLVAIYFPSLSRTVETSRLVKCSSNLRQLYMAAEIYVNNTGTTPIWNEYPDDDDRRAVLGLPDSVFRCPSDPNKGVNRRGGRTSYDLSGIARLRALSLKRFDPNNSDALSPTLVVFRDYTPSHYFPLRCNSIRLNRQIREYPDLTPLPRNR
jgi:type II secretory pathway pseudopilin PulG